MPKAANETGYTFWKVRVGIPGGILHLASHNEPTITTTDGTITHVSANWIDDHRAGDTIGHITWTDVRHITWRLSPAQPQETTR